jgi:hypothetical protein
MVKIAHTIHGCEKTLEKIKTRAKSGKNRQTNIPMVLFYKSHGSNSFQAQVF